MSTELKDTLILHIGTFRKPKYKVFDVFDSPDFDLVTITSASFQLLREDTGEVIDSGDCYVNNADEDRAGNAIKTIQCELHLTNTEAADGELATLNMHVYLSNGEDDEVRQNCKIVDYARRF